MVHVFGKLNLKKNDFLGFEDVHLVSFFLLSYYGCLRLESREQMLLNLSAHRSDMWDMWD